jgi:hypothetical protein
MTFSEVPVKKKKKKEWLVASLERKNMKEGKNKTLTCYSNLQMAFREAPVKKKKKEWLITFLQYKYIYIYIYKKRPPVLKNPK